MNSNKTTSEDLATLEEMILREVKRGIRKYDPNPEDYCIRVDRDERCQWVVSTVDMIESVTHGDNYSDCPYYELMFDKNIEREEAGEESVGEYEDWHPDLDAIHDFAKELTEAYIL